MSETLDYSFWIVWTGSRYKVSIPNYEGGAVIPIKHYQDLLAERDALKAELAEERKHHEEHCTEYELQMNAKIRQLADAKWARGEAQP